MQVEAGKVITLSFDICTMEGDIIESSGLSGPVTFLHGSGGLIPGVNARIDGMSAGEEKTFTLPPDEAFGSSENAPIHTIPRAEFPADAGIEVGGTFEASTPSGQSIKIKVVELSVDEVKAQMLHPLVDQSVQVSVKVESCRDATRAESQQGKVISAPPPAPPPVRS